MKNLPLLKALFQNSVTSSLLLLGLILLLLQFPLAKLDSLIAERQHSQWQVQQEVTASWGGEQQVAGPYLIVPWVESAPTALRFNLQLPDTERRYAVLLPSRLNISARARPEVRYRGLYEVPLYQADISVEAEFSRPDPAAFAVKPEQWQWQEARVVMTLSDLKALTGSIDATWQQSALEVMPGSSAAPAGFHFPLKDPFAQSDTAQFTLNFSLNGSQRLMAAPLGRTSVIQMEGAWPAPGFQGEWLPSQRTVTEQGFSAQWEIPFIARGLPVQWQGHSVDLKQSELHWVGVQLQPAVDAYRQIERATKYQLLFLLMVFGFFWLFQTLAGVAVHGLHYVLTGGALCLFYLLLLSLAEHLGFVSAYLCASAAVIIQMTLYGKSVLQSWLRAIGLGVLLACLFGYLWSLLQEQDYALLFGAAGLFAALSLVMFLTRRRLAPA